MPVYEQIVLLAQAAVAPVVLRDQEEKIIAVGVLKYTSGSGILFLSAEKKESRDPIPVTRTSFGKLQYPTSVEVKPLTKTQLNTIRAYEGKVLNNADLELLDPKASHSAHLQKAFKECVKDLNLLDASLEERYQRWKSLSSKGAGGEGKGFEIRADAAMEDFKRDLPSKFEPGLWLLAVVSLALITLFLLIRGQESILNSLVSGKPARFPHPRRLSCPATYDLDPEDPARRMYEVLSVTKGIKGIHLQQPLSALPEVLGPLVRCCGGGGVLQAPGPLTNIEALRRFIEKPLHVQKAPQCYVYVVSVNDILLVQDALKELIEKNTLMSEPVLPAHAPGLFIIASEQSRAELKDVLPHRVVHLLSPM